MSTQTFKTLDSQQMPQHELLSDKMIYMQDTRKINNDIIHANEESYKTSFFHKPKQTESTPMSPSKKIKKSLSMIAGGEFIPMESSAQTAEFEDTPEQTQMHMKLSDYVAEVPLMPLME